MSISAYDLAAEVGLAPSMVPDLEPVVAALRALVPSAPPKPSPALAALLAHPPAPPRPQPVARRRLFALGTAAAALSSVAVTGVAAAANELPPGAQQLVSDFSGRFLPFQFPEPVTMTPVPDGPAAVPPAGQSPSAPRSAVGDPLDSPSVTTKDSETVQPRLAPSSTAPAEVVPPPSSPQAPSSPVSASVSELPSAEPSPSGSSDPSASTSPAADDSASASASPAVGSPAPSASSTAQARETGTATPSPSVNTTASPSSPSRSGS